jgi:hypothetical protein
MMPNIILKKWYAVIVFVENILNIKSARKNVGLKNIAECFSGV